MNKNTIHVSKYSNHADPSPTAKELFKSLNKSENKIRARMGRKIVVQPVVDHGLKLLGIDRLSRRHIYIDDYGEMRIYRDPIFNDEKERLQMLIGVENKRKILKALTTNPENPFKNHLRRWIEK